MKGCVWQIKRMCFAFAINLRPRFIFKGSMSDFHCLCKIFIPINVKISQKGRGDFCVSCVYINSVFIAVAKIKPFWFAVITLFGLDFAESKYNFTRRCS